MEPIWNRPERAARGPRPAHSRDEIAAAAVRVADAEGIDAVSMRRVAAELGTGTTSLYRYVSRKDDLLDLMVDAVMREEDPPEPGGDWRADLRVLAGRTRALLLRHPWFSAVAAARPGLGPGSLRWLEAWLRAVDGLGLDPDGMLAAVGTLRIFVQGAVLGEHAERAGGYDNDAWLAAQGSYGDRIIAEGAYPRLVRIMVEARAPHRADRHDTAFALGLERVLDGLAAFLPSP
ncbi:TetR/AcrR family transcriptional regulator C-terminal domain-containing protein [Microbispora corallina]|uniref:TetR family transcriptional regulator n=1 Tax=Microbispora corallina TaxID=83302 RepID=A0ABQ4FW81_9ACTN|nr:TetR/AcrR family transcriptional regulator [Microbispora corallina]GIH39076.1 TetR family transcriptional regulator [Microbispora corallina]